MHEMGAVMNIVRSAERLAKKFGVSELGYVKVEVGELTGALPRYLLEMWPHGVKNSVCAGAELLIKETKGFARCSICKKEYPVMENLTNNFPVCPYCGCEKYKVIKGQEIVITELGVPK